MPHLLLNYQPFIDVMKSFGRLSERGCYDDILPGPVYYETS